MTSLPVVGNVAAGQPILAEENIESYLPIPAESVPTGEPCFVLNVRGDSMINAGILDGDQIFVQCCQEAYNGQIVVALIDDSATVKRFYKEKDHIRLQPENDTMGPDHRRRLPGDRTCVRNDADLPLNRFGEGHKNCRTYN